MKSLKKVLAVFIMVAVAVTFLPLIDGQVYAASKKKPAAPKITYGKEVSDVTDDFKVVVVKWEKAKGAKKYQVGARSPEKMWVKAKTVKKSAKNKKKYTKKNKYRVVAKGKKYIVYQYTYKYIKLDVTKACSYRFTEAYNWEDIAPYKTYIFAVRSVNGKKYSAWKTVAVKTGPGPYEEKVLTSAGQSVKINLDKTSVTFTVGKQCTVPMPKPKKGTLAAKPLSVIPAKIQYNLVRDKAGNSEEVVIEGKLSDGRSVYCRLSTELGYYNNINYSIGAGTSSSSGGKFICEGLGYGPGYYGKQYVIKDPNTSVVWATDGTEPKLGQANKSINGSEYPFGPVTSNQAPYNGSVQVRGSGDSENGSTTIWGGLKKALFNKCEWVRVYDKNTIVGESFFYEGYYN